jgi:hypothetical protein
MYLTDEDRKGARGLPERFVQKGALELMTGISKYLVQSGRDQDHL